MNVKEYRRIIEERLAEARGGALESMPRAIVPPQERAKAALLTLSDSEAPSDQRVAALAILNAASFDVTAFASMNAELTGALQRVATDEDASPELRRDALETLVVDHDEIARDVLERAVAGSGAVSPAVALGLLARDDHGSAVDLARDTLASSDDPAVRAQAVRIIGNAPDSTETLRTLIRDKDEDREVRRASAIALRALQPDIFETEATRILKDTSDFPEIRSTLEGVMQRQGRGGL